MTESAGRTSSRRAGTWRLGVLLGGVLSPAARARGFAEASVLADWATIVGTALALRCEPVALSFAGGRRQGGVLELRAGGGAALELQHAAPQLIQRINDYFGFRAVGRLRVLQAPTVGRRQPAPPRPRPTLGPDEEALVAQTTASIRDDGLRAALCGLGCEVRLRERERRRPPRRQEEVVAPPGRG
jgi:hypothetical protein